MSDPQRRCATCDHHRWDVVSSTNCPPCLSSPGLPRWKERRPDPTIEERALDLLVEIHALPLMSLADWPNGTKGLELRLGHFAPALSERVAELLEEVGR